MKGLVRSEPRKIVIDNSLIKHFFNPLSPIHHLSLLVPFSQMPFSERTASSKFGLKRRGRIGRGWIRGGRRKEGGDELEERRGDGEGGEGNGRGGG